MQMTSSESTGGTLRVKLVGTGALDISFCSAPGVTIGSLEGKGAGQLRANHLTVGSNNHSTSFRGVIGGAIACVGLRPTTP